MEYKDLLVGGLYLAIVAVIWFFKKVAPVYVSERTKNLATKQDVKDITDKVESVRHFYAKGLAEFQSELWSAQQKEMWMREEYKIKLEAFARSSMLVIKLKEAMFKAQHFIANKECHFAGHVLMADPQHADERFNQYLELREETKAAIYSLKEVLVELAGVRALLSVYFERDLYLLSGEIVKKSEAFTQRHWTTEEFLHRVRSEYEAVGDWFVAKEKVADKYLEVADAFYPGKEINDFFDRQRQEVSSMRQQV